ncbi:response regulator transcription factor [Pendulispora rubella]|uniref:Response regulator transcription factor n=1 Tax=Pendulispora rubella TaxID=2741070 RepID=A0ABZ2LND3_9BACT
MSRRVLLVEDDSELGAQIVHRLQDHGFEAVWWREGRRVAQEDLRGFDLVIVDLMLPGVYGMDMLKDVRTCSEVPVLVLSARDATADKVRALKLGADDYMTKPFWPEELMERVRARLRRPALGRGDVLEAGALRIDRARREAQWKGERLELTRVEFEFLSALAERPGEAMTRRALAERALDPERDGGERTLDVHVSRLRKKLAQMGETSLIETVWGIGYRLAP